jgi:hypothetical protein
MTRTQILQRAIDQALWREEQAASTFMAEPSETNRQCWAQARGVVDQLARTT